MKKVITFLTLLFISSAFCGGMIANPKYHFSPCLDNLGIQITYTSRVASEDENRYKMAIAGNFMPQTWLTLLFDTDASITLEEGVHAVVYRSSQNRQYFRVVFYDYQINLYLTVQGLTTGFIPYLKSIQMDNFEYCNQPTTGFLERFLQNSRNRESERRNKQNTSCGRRALDYKELIVNGASTSPGDWPWHVAIYRLDKAVVKYICGGTLISEKFVLTAAHCTTIQGVKVLPEILSVVMGKYNLIGGDGPSQERMVHDIIVNDKFTKKNLDNDISLLKLKTMAVFDDYIQPICLWNDDVATSIPSGEIKGTVVGWGFDHTDKLSAHLMQTTMTILPEATCIKKNSLFYSKILNENKFCAGASNGTSPCNGDSGGGFVVFVPDTPGDDSHEATGSYFIRGIVSTTVSIPNRAVCDPEYYVVFTDISKYKTWIEDSIKDK